MAAGHDLSEVHNKSSATTGGESCATTGGESSVTTGGESRATTGQQQNGPFKGHQTNGSYGTIPSLGEPKTKSKTMARVQTQSHFPLPFCNMHASFQMFQLIHCHGRT